MGHTRSIFIGLALVLGQTAGAAAADLGLPPPPPVVEAPCVGCAGPWYIRGFVGGANPHVDDISSELFKFNDFQRLPQRHQELAVCRWRRRLRIQQMAALRRDRRISGRCDLLGQDRYPGGSDGFNRAGHHIGTGDVLIPAPTNTRRTFRAGSASSTAISTSAPITASRPSSAAVSASPRSRSAGSRMSTCPTTACSSVRPIPRRTSPGPSMEVSPMT